MRTAAKLKHKLRQVIYRHRQKYVKQGVARRPCNCVHNGMVTLPSRQANQSVIRLCLYQVEDREQWNNRACDEKLGGIEQAKDCPYFKCRNTPDDLKKQFSTMMGLDGTAVKPDWLARHYPDVVALLWALGDDLEFNTGKAEQNDTLVMVGKDTGDE